MNESLEQARLLLGKARDDAFMMRELMKNPRSPSWGIAFHAQQAVEKAIKAVLASRGVAFPFTHDLKLLLNLLSSRAIPLPPNEEGILSLLPYGAVLRYESFPEDEVEEELDRKQVENVVTDIVEWAQAAMSEGEMER